MIRNTIPFCFLLIFLLACKEKDIYTIKYYNVKGDILYKDENNNLYIKNDVHLLHKEDTIKKETRYFDLVSYRDSVVTLKKFVDIKSFRRISKDTFRDNTFIYLFIDKPSVFPNIRAFDSTETKLWKIQR